MTNPFEKLTTEAAIKSAYRKLSLQCHPDMRPASEKKQAEEEFGLLTRVYQRALDNLGHNTNTKEEWWHRDPAPPSPPPAGHYYRDTVDLGHIDNFEFDNWGEAMRTFICSRALLMYGGVLTVKYKVPKVQVKIFGASAKFGQNEDSRSFDIPPNQPNPGKYKINLPIGPVILTLVGRR